MRAHIISVQMLTPTQVCAPKLKEKTRGAASPASLIALNMQVKPPQSSDQNSWWIPTALVAWIWESIADSAHVSSLSFLPGYSSPVTASSSAYIQGPYLDLRLCVYVCVIAMVVIA
jgi:hypothetical protein